MLFFPPTPGIAVQWGKKRNIVVDACFSQPHYPWSSLLVQLVFHLMSLNHFFHSAMKLLAPEQHNIPILSLPTIIKFSAINLLWAILDLLHKDMSFLLRELFFSVNPFCTVHQICQNTLCSDEWPNHIYH